MIGIGKAFCQNFDPYENPGQRNNVSTNTSAEPDSLEGTVEKDKTPWSWKKNPKLATILGLALPGAGQIYNKKYWKLPIVWGGMGILLYQAVQSGHKFEIFKEAYNASKASDFKTNWAINNYAEEELWKFTTQNLAVVRDSYRQDRDRYIIFSAFVYLCSVVDAAVDAHLSTFDVSDNLSLRLLPKALDGFATGMSIQIDFKNKETAQIRRNSLKIHH